MLDNQFKAPEEGFVKFFASRVYDGVLTAKVKTQFLEITTKAVKQFLNDSINERLKSAIDPVVSPKINVASQLAECADDVKKEGAEESPKVVTTEEEIDGFNIVKAIFRQKLNVDRIVARDTQSYFGVLLDDNNRKPLCRLYFNTKQKYIGIFDVDKKETKHPLESLDDIFSHSEKLLDTVELYQ